MPRHTTPESVIEAASEPASGLVSPKQGELADDLGVGIGGKAQAAVGLRNDHREEFLGLEKVPHFGRQIAQLPADAPLVEHAAELVDRAVEERQLLGGERRGRHGQELSPIGIAAEEVGVPPHVAGFDRLALGVGERGQHLLRPAEDRLGDKIAAE